MTAEELTKAILRDALANALSGKEHPERVHRYAQLLLDLREALRRMQHVHGNTLRYDCSVCDDTVDVLARADEVLK